MQAKARAIVPRRWQHEIYSLINNSWFDVDVMCAPASRERIGSHSTAVKQIQKLRMSAFLCFCWCFADANMHFHYCMMNCWLLWIENKLLCDHRLIFSSNCKVQQSRTNGIRLIRVLCYLAAEQLIDCQVQDCKRINVTRPIASVKSIWPPLMIR